jgi:hypothetical protein
MNQRLVLAVAAVLVTISAAVAGAAPLETRQMRLERRIDRGVVTGQLTREDARRLQLNQRQIRFQIAESRRDGRMTARERARIERELMRQEMLCQRLQHHRRQW